jgi:hypothetical protein
MYDGRHLRDLTPPTGEGAPQSKVIGLELAHRCTFCGGPSEATLGCHDATAPIIFQIQIRNNCLVDCVTPRSCEVNRGRLVQLARDTVAATLVPANDRELEAAE